LVGMCFLHVRRTTDELFDISVPNFLWSLSGYRLAGARSSGDRAPDTRKARSQHLLATLNV
jgi:hypothetical protein